MKLVYKKKQPEIVQLKITLRNSKPPIWRRLLIEKSITFEDLHNIIQDAMGWENCHLYEFSDANTTISSENFENVFLETLKASKISVGEILNNLKQKLTYIYDFGDCWEHLILVEKFLEKEKSIDYPICIKGKNNCPPEDCGGIWRFYWALEVIENKNHPEREEVLDWLGKNYNPSYFKLDEINERLH